MDRIPRKDMKTKHFRLSTDVRSTLQRKHDKWTPVCAFNRLSKDLSVLHALSKVLLTFFKKDDDGNEEDILCDGRVVKMFADMIRKSFKDEDFISGLFLFILLRCKG